MVEKMIVVRFVRRDGRPDEEYWYGNLEDAELHFRLFLDDDSGLYDEILLIFRPCRSLSP